MNAPLETYLRRATRGVWGKKRLELIAELRGNIEARIWMLVCQGYAPERALEVALSELGEPRAIAAGLIGVHTMPQIFRSTLALGLFAALSVTLINSSRAQIEVIGGGTFVIKTAKYRITVTGASGTYFLKFSSIKENLESAGITVDDTPSESLNQSTKVDMVPTLRFRFPESDRDTALQSTPITSNSVNLVDNAVTSTSVSTDLSDESGYIALSEFFYQIRQRSGLPVRVSGWRNPIIEIGATKLQIGTEKASATPREIFVQAAGRAAQNGFPQLNAWIGFGIGGWKNNHAVRLNDPPGTVYAVVTPSPPISSVQAIDAARVADDGVLYFNAVYKVLEFVKTPLELVKDRANISKRGYGSSSRPAKALLIRITPDLKTSFVLPARVRSGALY